MKKNNPFGKKAIKTARQCTTKRYSMLIRLSFPNNTRKRFMLSAKNTKFVPYILVKL